MRAGIPGTGTWGQRRCLLVPNALMSFSRSCHLSNSIDCICLHFAFGTKHRHVVQKGILFVVTNEAHVPVHGRLTRMLTGQL